MAQDKENNRNNSPKVILLDANILIHSTRFIPAKYFPKYWKQLKDSISEGKVFMLDTTLKEFQDPGYEIIINNKRTKKYYYKEWRKKIEPHRKDTGDFIARRNELYQEYNSHIKNEEKHISRSDLMLIAFAEKDPQKYTIFSYEGITHKGVRKERSNSNERYKIPDVCEKLNIKYMYSFEEFLDLIDFKPLS